jgi:hypothetical protein
MAKKKKSKKLDMRIKLPKGARYKVDVPPELFTLPCSFLIHSSPGGGKTTLVYNIIQKYKQAGLCDRVILVSPTAQSNSVLRIDLGIKDEDIFSPTDKSVPAKITQIVEDERDEFERDLDRQEDYRKFGAQLRSGKSVYEIEDDLWLQFTDDNGDLVSKPEMKYKNAVGGRPQLFTIWDDCISSPCWEKNQSFLNYTTRQRHLGAMTYDPKHRSGHKVGALGMSNLYLIHSLKCERGGLPKLVRQNAFQIAIVNNTANKKELQSLCEACSGRVDEDVFYDLYKRSQQKDHDTFLIDFLYRKEDHPSMFRRNLDEFLIPDKSVTYASSVPEKKKKKGRKADKVSKAEQRRLAAAEQPSPNELAVDNVNTENKIC